MNLFDENIEKLSKDFEEIWYAYESREEFITYDDDGIKFDYFKCCKIRVTSMGMTLQHVFNKYEDVYTKQILINSFALALSRINKQMNDTPLQSKIDVGAYFASIHTLINLAKELKESI
jgi:hypothetical protein